MIVFIDFDGVMHPAGCSIDRYFEKAGLLANWLREHDEVMLVASSSWRETHKLSELKELLFHDHPDIQERMVDVTQVLDLADRERDVECRLWLCESADHDYTAWAALDDQAERFEPQTLDHHLVVCDSAIGLTQAALDQAWQLLKLQRLDEPGRRARRQPNWEPLDIKRHNLSRPLPDDSSYGPEIKPLTDEEEASIVAAIVQARDQMEEIDRAVAAAATERRAKWMSLPEDQRWATLVLDLDEVLCVGQPDAASTLQKSLNAGQEPDKSLLAALFAPSSVAALRHVHEALDGRLRYVISSSWREHFSREQLELIFRSSGLAFVADDLHPGAAWRCYQACFQPDRQGDIEFWLEQFHHGEPFVILDDRHSGGSLVFVNHFPGRPLHGRVILCKPGVGLTKDHVDDILAALRRPIDA